MHIALNSIIERIESKGIYISAYADDTLVVVHNQQQFDTLIEIMDSFAVESNLKWRKSKTKAIVVEWDNLMSHGIEIVSEFKYLGTILYSSLRCPKRITTINESQQVYWIFLLAYCFSTLSN